jgi:transcriptional regulator GlxA family with amidase domain
MVIITPNKMAQVAREVLNMPPRNKKAEDSTFREFFGAQVEIIAVVWNLMENTLEKPAKPKHLLWTMVFIRRTFSSCGLARS